MAGVDDVRLEQQVAAPPAREPWTDGKGQYPTFGTITELEPPHLLAMSWKDEGWAFETAVTITITGEQDKTLVSLRHHGWEAAPADERGQLVADHSSGWSNT